MWIWFDVLWEPDFDLEAFSVSAANATFAEVLRRNEVPATT